jgi:hypothetical protein
LFKAAIAVPLLLEHAALVIAREIVLLDDPGKVRARGKRDPVNATEGGGRHEDVALLAQQEAASC